MFKCKIDLAAYDKSNKTVPTPEFGKAKAIAKASVKKLASKAGEKTDFYITKDYFENNGKPISHFFAVGKSKKLAKEFLTKEIKGKGVANDPKSAATGTVCIKNIGGKEKLCFEPHDKCKIPAGQWPKLLKALKPFFAGFKAVVIVEGQTLEEEPGGEEDNSNDADDDIVFEDSGAEDEADETDGDEGEEKDTVGSGKVDAAKTNNTALVDNIKNLIKDIAGSMKGEVVTTIVPNIKNKNVTDKDLNTSTDLLQKIEELKKLYDTAEDKIKAALKPHVDQVLAFAPKVTQIKDAINKILGAVKNDANANETSDAVDAAKAAAEALLKEAQEYLKNFQKNIGTLKEDISNAAEEAIAGGKDLLNKLFQ